MDNFAPVFSLFISRIIAIYFSGIQRKVLAFYNNMCQSKFERMAHEAKATYKLDKLVLVNAELFEKYLETFGIVE